MAAKPKFAVGIDLGTTHSAIGFSSIVRAPNGLTPVARACGATESASLVAAAAMERHRLGRPPSIFGPGAAPGSVRQTARCSRPSIEILPIPQLVAPGAVGELPLLPSAIYLPAEGELAEGATLLPWNEASPFVVGELARRLGAQIPGRLVASAKSWLSYAGVDRSAAILPWGAGDEVGRISPVEASARILSHLRAAWDFKHPEAPLVEQEVILTVPASFDEVARELTVEAMRLAGLGRARLLEEPQAAFYDFIHRSEGGRRSDGEVREAPRPEDAAGGLAAALEAALGEPFEKRLLALVVDVGGGTTDLTLITLEPSDAGAPRIERIAVGEHLMLGGDNMDLTLARQVEAELQGPKLDAAQWPALVEACRIAKEKLLSKAGPEVYGVSVVGRGARLIGGARTHQIAADEARRILLDGFLPTSGATEVPMRKGRVALTELGLPYASDPAISRHVCAFLRRHVEAAAQAGARIVDGLPMPDLVLLNGGVFNAPAVEERLQEVLAGWFPGESIPLLGHGSLDLAVARGAASYGLVRRGIGTRIRGGSPRAFYVGVETGEAKPTERLAAAHQRGIQAALCVIPKGMEEGSSLQIASRTFELVVGEPVSFPLYSSTVDRADEAGEVVELGAELDPLPPLHTVIRVAEPERARAETSAGSAPVQEAAQRQEPTGPQASTRRQGAARKVKVRLESALTELGTLELWLRTVEGQERRWRLEFSLRGEGGGAALAPIDQLPRRFDEAKALVERIYGKTAQPVEPREIKGLWRNLEKIIGERDTWTSAVNRELWTVVFGGSQKRRRSADHERLWFQLVGFCLRPGTGAPLDEWRVGELWKVFEQGVQYTTEKANWSEWWILWRRVAGGLQAGQQRRIFEWIRPWLKPATGRFPAKPKGPKAEGFDEMVRLVASLERLSAAEKDEAGGWVLHRLDEGRGSWWPIGRLGARQPLFGSAHDVVRREVAAAWLERLFALDWKRAEGAAFAAAQIARLSGDRGRDLEDELRERVAQRLEAAASAEGWIRMVREGGELTTQDEVRVFGESLPVGLRLA